MTASNGDNAVVVRRIRWKPITAYALIVAVVMVSSVTNYVHQREQFRRQTEDELNAIAKLKTTQLVTWREERLSDARVLAANPFTVAALLPILKGKATSADESNVRTWLKARMGHLSYSAALLLDATGGIRLAVGRAEGATDAWVGALLEDAARAGKPVLSDFCSATPPIPYIHLDLAVPICDLNEPSLPPSGFVLYHIDPELFLYPFIQSWPTPSLSGETLLARRDGDDVLFLNELRRKTNTALRLRVPLSNTALPTTQAILGKTGIVEGLDYAGIPVIAVVRRVPDTSWYLVAKVNEEEADAPLRARAWFTALFSAGAILAGGAILAFLIKRRQAVFLMTQLDAERELAAIYENAPLVMLLMDSDRRVRKMNRFAEQFAGGASGERIGMRGGEALRCLHALDDPRGCGFGPKCEGCVIRRIVMDTLTTGAQHSQEEASFAVSESQTMTVLVSTSVLESRGEQMALVAIQDISGRKAAEDQLRFQNLILSAQQEAALDGILVVDENAKIVSYNRLFVEMMGIPRELAEQKMDEPILQFVTNQMSNPQHFLRKVKYLYEHKEEISQDELLLKNGRHIDRYTAPLTGPDKQYYGRIWFFRDVTESKRADDALHESETRHRVLFESSRDAIMTLAPPTWRFTGANPAMIEMFKAKTIGAFMALEPWQLSPERQPDGRPSEEKAREMIEKAVREGSNYFEWTHRRLDGMDFPATVLLSRMQVGGETILQATVRDITESKQTQAALAERARTDAFGAEVGRALVEPAPLRDILQACCESAVKHLDASFARIWVLNPKDQVLELQASAGLYTHIDGPHSRVAMGQFKIGRIAQTRQPHLTNQVIGDPEVGDQEWARREGMVAFAGYPLLLEDRLIGVMAIFSHHPLGALVLQAIAVVAYSIAVGIERKNAEERIRRLNESLEMRVLDRTAQFEVSNRELETFAYSVSHDLRGPLRAIDGFSLSVLKGAQGLLNKDMMEDLMRVRKATQRMSRLIDSLLTLSRTTRQEMSIEPVDLSLIAGEIASELQKSDASRSAEFAITPGIVVNGDKQLLHVALQNLLMNSWKFTKNCTQALIEFGVTTSVECPVSRVGQEHPTPDTRNSAPDTQHPTRVFFVRDNGAGFDMTYVDKLFGTFQRLHSEKEFEGTGIGLATVQRIIHRHGGKVWAEGMVGAGATFYFTM